MIWLLDGNILSALMIDTHVHHLRTKHWFASLTDPFATCSVTEGTFLRLHMRLAADTSAKAAWTTLAQFQSHPRHTFLDDGFSYAGVSTHLIQGHKQVTDAWLAELARRHGARLATLDTGLVATHADVGFLIP
ncbi:MAG: PIN domain-containing protein [Verrucomicrobiaceae bacterium]|nr:PIN domain-containing protein [Verrucomicrobiaceae bacterium]